MRKLLILIAFLLIFAGIASAVQQFGPDVTSYLRSVGVKTPDLIGNGTVRVVSEESVVIDVVKKVGPSVVTVAETSQVPEANQFDPFSLFGLPGGRGDGSSTTPQTQNIGSGFIVSKDGIVVTNKHVVSDLSAKYTVITADDKKYTVEKIYRDQANDIALLKINPDENKSATLSPVSLGDSSKLQVGQLAIAIGTPLGEFNNSVTKGIISGLGRGITAGSPYEGFAEKLDGVIQTDAAISPGNSGGPLLNSDGQVIGVNTAVSENGENLGFALPVNLIKERMNAFNRSGQFERAYLGVSYKMVSRQLALQNDVPEGAYVQSVVKGSPADNAGLQDGDIITAIDGQKINERDGELATRIDKQKVGQVVTITAWREESNGSGSSKDFKVTLGNATEQ
jgi:serine protease Do